MNTITNTSISPVNADISNTAVTTSLGGGLNPIPDNTQRDVADTVQAVNLSNGGQAVIFNKTIVGPLVDLPFGAGETYLAFYNSEGEQVGDLVDLDAAFGDLSEDQYTLEALPNGELVVATIDNFVEGSELPRIAYLELDASGEVKGEVNFIDGQGGLANLQIHTFDDGSYYLSVEETSRVDGDVKAEPGVRIYSLRDDVDTRSAETIFGLNGSAYDLATNGDAIWLARTLGEDLDYGVQITGWGPDQFFITTFNQVLKGKEVVDVDFSTNVIAALDGTGRLNLAQVSPTSETSDVLTLPIRGDVLDFKVIEGEDGSTHLAYVVSRVTDGVLNYSLRLAKTNDDFTGIEWDYTLTNSADPAFLNLDGFTIDSEGSVSFFANGEDDIQVANFDQIIQENIANNVVEVGDFELFNGDNDFIFPTDGPAMLIGSEKSNQIELPRGRDVEAFDGNRIIAGNGDDTLGGSDGNDRLNGGNGKDTISGHDGNDSIYAGTGNDSADGGAGNDFIHGQQGKDTLSGGEGDDLIRGGNGADTLNGDAGNDTLQGGGSRDTLNGGEGDDTLTGGNGKDTFSFDGGHGNDVITDFNAALDIIDFGFNTELGFNDFADITANATETDAGLLITTGAETSILLEDMTMDALSADNFSFSVGLVIG